MLLHTTLYNTLHLNTSTIAHRQRARATRPSEPLKGIPQPTKPGTPTHSNRCNRQVDRLRHCQFWLGKRTGLSWTCNTMGPISTDSCCWSTHAAAARLLMQGALTCPAQGCHPHCIPDPSDQVSQADCEGTGMHGQATKLSKYTWTVPVAATRLQH